MRYTRINGSLRPTLSFSYINRPLSCTRYNKIVRYKKNLWESFQSIKKTFYEKCAPTNKVTAPQFVRVMARERQITWDYTIQ